MEHNYRGIGKVMAVMAALLLVLAATLFNLTIIRGSAFYDDGQDNKRRTIVTTAARGKIVDRNGVPLAYDKTCYNVDFYRDPFRTGDKWRALYTEIIIKTITIIERNGNESIDTLSLKRDDEGKFYFDFGLAAEVSEEAYLDETERAKQQKLRDETLKKRYEMWCDNMGINKKITSPEEAYTAVRQKFMIPDDLDYGQARKVLSIWQDVQERTYKSYEPVTIAYDVDISTVAEITESSNELDGMTVEEDYIRTYPHGETAAHIVGYMSKQYDEKLEELIDKGYSADATVGVSGVEATMEEYLSSQIGTRAGEQVVEVDSRGKVIREIESKGAEQGYDVELTTDYELQRKAEEILKKHIEEIEQDQLEIYEANYEERTDGQNRKPYKELEEDRGGNTTKFAKTGAVIVIDVNTGQILALASYPSFDPNLFSRGIGEDDYKLLNDEETTPMFNKAISSKAEPGSIFKMVTGYAALRSGAIKDDETISCTYQYVFNSEDLDERQRTSKTNPKCWINESKVHEHADQDIVAGLKNSCNIFFYTISERMKNDVLNEWSNTFGLTSKTNIELTGEVTGHVANPTVLFDNTKPITGVDQKTYKPILVRNRLATELKTILSELGRQASDEKCTEAATEMVKLVNSGLENRGPSIREILRKVLDVPETVSNGRGLAERIDNILYEITWTPLQTILTGIGQSTTAVTPIAVSRYVAAIANGGTVYECNIVKRVVDKDGNVIVDSNPKVQNTLNDVDGSIDKIQMGMNEVASEEDGGTAADEFSDFAKVTITDDNGQTKEVPDMAGKTGSAQVSKIDIENTAWFVGYTPFEQPEIAVVVYVPNGMAGWRTAPVAKEIMEYYREKKDLKKQDTIKAPGSLLD